MADDDYATLARRYGWPVGSADRMRALGGVPPLAPPHVINAAPTVMTGPRVINAAPTVMTGRHVIDAAPTVMTGRHVIDAAPTIMTGPRIASPVVPHAPPSGIDASWMREPILREPLSWMRTSPVGTEPAPDDARLRAVLAAGNRRPGDPQEASFPSLFAPPAAKAANPADLRQPKDGNWAAANAFIDEQNQKRASANIEGATFADGPDQGQGGGGAGRPGGPVMVDPGGRRPASWQIQQGLELGDDANEALGDADLAGREAAELDYAAGRKAAEFERGYLERYSDASKKYAAEESERTQKYSQQVDSHMGKLDELRAQIREAKVDPFGGMNAGIAQLGQALAIGLGAFASKRGENAGLEAVKWRINQNIQGQEKEIDRLDRGARGEQTFLAQMRQQYGDIGVAREATRIAYLEQSKVELAKQLGDPEVADPRLMAGYQRLVQKLDDELINRTANFKGLTQDRVVRHDVNARPTFVGGAEAKEAKEAKSDARYLADAYEKANIPTTLAELKEVDRVVDTFGDEDIPGVGPILSMVPSVLLSDRAVAGRQVVKGVKNAIGHARFGGAVTPDEAARLAEEVDGAKDASSLRRTIQKLRATLQHRSANIAAGASRAGVGLYEERGGSVQQGQVSQRQVSPGKPSTPYIKEAK